MISYWLSLIGCWLFCDSIISLTLYIGKPDEQWIKNHSIRLIRGILSIILMYFGYILWK